MKLEVQIAKVVAVTEGNYFIALQVDYDDPRTPTQKFRTDLAPLALRPHFARNFFPIQPLIAHQRIKFALMGCADNNEASIGSAKLVGLASMSLALEKLKTLPPQGHQQIVKLLSKGKEVGQFECQIRFITERQGGGKGEKEFKPVMSRILFAEEATGDEVQMEGRIRELQRQIEQLFIEFKEKKGEEQKLEGVLSQLLKDQQELKREVEVTERINQKLSLKLSQRESLQSLNMEIEMLRSSEEGRNLLCDKLDYFEERIRIEDEEHRLLSQRYDSIKQDIHRRIQKAHNYADKLRSKDLQLFELANNQQLLQRYEQVHYEFSCNQHIIQSLTTSAPSPFTAHQAALLLSHVNHNLQLETLSPPHPALLTMIEQEAALGSKQQEQLSEEQKIVLSIKLAALEQQASVVRNKLRHLLPHRR